MTLVSYPRMSTTRSSYVSQFEYVPRFHPSRNPDCPSRFTNHEHIDEDSEEWNRPAIEIRAAVSRCSAFTQEKTLGDDFHVRGKRRYDEEQDRGTITNCIRNIVISLRFNNIGKTEIEEKFIVIDHVLDPITMKKIPLQNPYVIKVRQETVLQLYGLKFQSRYQQSSRQDLADSRIDRATLNKVVNAEAREEVINNRSPNYTGCDVDSEQPTCGRSFMRGKPVPFSQGFCCSCDSQTSDRRQYGGWNKSWDGKAKSNYNHTINKPCNRLRTGSKCSSSNDNSVARSQAKGDEARSGKKSATLHANLFGNQTPKSYVFEPETCHKSNQVLSKEACVNKGTENHEDSHESRKNETLNSSATKSIARERYKGKQGEVSSTWSLFLSPEMVAGRPPSRDKVASSVDVERDRASTQTNVVFEVKSGRVAGERTSKRGGSTTGIKNSESTSEDRRNQCEVSRDGKGTSNREFHSISSKAEAKKLSREEGERSKNPFVSEPNKCVNSIHDEACSGSQFRLSTKYEWRKKLLPEMQSMEVNGGKDVQKTERKKCRAESSYGNKGPPLKSGKKRNKMFPVTSTIDSLAIRPSMHLNEPLKNLSTGVLNSNGSPVAWPARTKEIGKGNLNRVMGNTSTSRETRLGTFNKKRERSGSFQSNGNKKDASCSETFAGDRRELVSNTVARRGNTLRKEDFSAREKKHPKVERIKNYTPQKRTLKDLSCRNSYDHRDGKKLKKQDVTGYGSKTNFRRSRRQLRNWKNWRSARYRSKRFNDLSRSRGRRKRSKKADDDKELVTANRKPGHVVRVYIDVARDLKGGTDGKSRSDKLANDEKSEITNGKGRKGNKMGDDTFSWDETSQQDSVDKQIEDKFSRISDVLKEDTMGSKAILTEKKGDTMSVNPVHEKEMITTDVGEQANKIEEVDDALPYQQIDEIPDRTEAIILNERIDDFDKNKNALSPLQIDQTVDGQQIVQAILNEKMDELSKKASSYNNKFDMNQGSYVASQDEASDELVQANQKDNLFANNPDQLLDNYKTSTSSPELVIPPPMGSSMMKKQNQVVSNMFAPEYVDNIDSNGDDMPLLNPTSFTSETSDLTQALIVVDLFKIATGSLTEYLRSTISTETLESDTKSPKLIDRLGGLKKNIEKAFQQLKPTINRTSTVNETTTIMLKESTTTNTTEETTSSVGMTKITDQTFRPVVKPTESAPRTSPGGAEFHKEVSIEGVTFPDETPMISVPTPQPAFVDLQSISRNVKSSKMRKKWINGRKKKVKRTTAPMIKKQDLEAFHETGKLDGRVYKDNPIDHGGKKRSTRADSAMKFSFKAANMNVVKERLGVTSSFSREQRNYVQVQVEDPGEAGKRIRDRLSAKKYPRTGQNEAKIANENVDGSRDVRRNREPASDSEIPDSSDIKWIHHPWFVTTESLEYTVKQKSNNDRVFFSKSSSQRKNKNAKNEDSLRQDSLNSATDGVLGRILPPCMKGRVRRVGDRGTKNVICEAETNRRGRRLLSVQGLKGDKSKAGHRSNKDQKKIQQDEDNFIKDDNSDIEYEEGASEHRKRLKSVRDKDHKKSKKRDATRSALKREKKNKGGDKEQSLPSSQESSSDYDYFLPGEQMDENDRTLLEEKQTDDGNSVEDSAGVNYDSDPALGDLLEKETDDDSKISDDMQNDNSYNQVSDSSSLFNEFDRYPKDVRTEGQMRSMEEENLENAEAENEEDGHGKDFEISFTGKIHLESDAYGRPVSISFNAEPEFFRRDFIYDGKANSYGNRFPLESANSFIDASDTLASDGTDNANFLPNGYDVESSLNAPLDQVDDRSVAREYFLDTMRARNRNAGRYRNDPRQRLIHLQKKSIEPSEDPTKQDSTSSKQSLQVSSSWKRSLKRLKKNSESFASATCVPKETEVEEREKFAGAEQDESLNVEDQNRVALISNEANSKKISDELLDDSPQVSLDQSNLPENNFENGDPDAAADVEKVGCYVLNSTTLKFDLAETTIVPDKYQGSMVKNTVLSIHDLKIEDSSNTTEPATETPKSAVTSPTIETTTIISSSNETVIEAQMSYPKPPIVIAAESATTTTTTTTVATTTKLTSSNETVIEAQMSYPKPKLEAESALQASPNLPQGIVANDDSKESIEKKNMLAISDFVRKLEKLVADTGNSSNTTGRTLIHLKKFIIVPDNRTFWSLKEFSAPDNKQGTATTETVVVMGEGTRIKDSTQSSVDNDESEYSEVEDNSRGENRNLIKEIIDSVIKGDDLKREVPFKRSDKLNDRKLLGDKKDLPSTADAPVASEWKDRSNEQEFETNLEVDKNSADLANIQEETPTKEESFPQNVGKNVDDQFLESNLENGKKTSRKDNDVCGNKSGVKEKRDTAVRNARSANQKREHENRGKKKDAKHLKKKRRGKRKRKTKKGKMEKNKRNRKKAKSKWPFKRNLLMLSEEEQIQPSNVDYRIKWRNHDEFSEKEGETKNTESTRKSSGENGLKEPQIRGGQDCSDHRHPPNVDPLKYLESAHCLRFSDLWYSVYQLEEPMVVHKIHLQIYMKRAMSDGSILWKDLTNGSIIRLGTFDKYYRNKENTVTFTYNDVRATSKIEYNLNPTRDRLLVPSTLSGKRSKYSEAEGWSSEYLVVQADKINEDANECDKAGVGFTAFVAQPGRCERVSGTCLKNQPLDYWRHDIEARESGRAGCYFLSNFARVPREAIKYKVNGTGSHQFLALEYHSLHVSVIDIELKDDYNALPKVGSSVQLTEVHVDNTAINYTVITMLISNKGSYSFSYRARITDCPQGVPASWLNAESATKTISSHRDRKVALSLTGRLSLNEFSCSVTLLSRYDEPVAWREIKVRKMDRCSCVGHYKCSCLSDAHDKKDCRPVSKEHYQTTGFPGPLFINSRNRTHSEVEPSSIWPDVITLVCLVLIVLLLLFLLLGFFKWIIGIFIPIVSRWGLDTLLETHKMRKYLEKDLKSKSVVFNRYRQPVHPDTGRKSVRICSRTAEFFLNLTFFFIYPFGMVYLSCKKPEYFDRLTNSDQSNASLRSEKNESHTMICVSTYGDSINSQMEAEDTKYVIDELKKSQESLQNYNKYKRKQTLRDQSSSEQ